MAISASNANAVSTLNGLFKEVYGDSVQNLIPDGVKLMKDVPFVPKNKTNGNEYHQPVIVAQEHGFSYGGPDGTAFALADPNPGQVKDAKVQGYEFVLRTAISTASISRSQGDHAAFESATKLIVANMVRSFAKRLECIMLYGQRNIGVVEAISGSVITITAASWAPGIWSGAVNMITNAFNAAGSTKRSGDMKITGINLATRAITVDTPATSLAPTDQLNHLGAGNLAHSAGSNEFPGLEAIMRNSGLLFNINAATYDLWKSTVYSAGSADLSFQKLNKAVALAAAKGLEEDVEVHVSPVTWAKLNSDQAALRMFDSSYKQDVARTGSKSLEYASANGVMKIHSNIYVKESLAFLFPKDSLMRVGSTDVTFKRPGQGDEYFRDLENNSGVELRAYTDQALFCYEPSKLVLIDNIVNS